MQYFVLWLTFPSFLTGELGGKNKRGEVEQLANPIKAQIKGMVNTETLHSH